MSAKGFFDPSRFYICELFLELRKTVLKSVNRKHSRTYSKGLHNQEVNLNARNPLQQSCQSINQSIYQSFIVV